MVAEDIHCGACARNREGAVTVRVVQAAMKASSMAGTIRPAANMWQIASSGAWPACRQLAQR
jgi:hypothetical protein